MTTSYNIFDRDWIENQNIIVDEETFDAFDTWHSATRSNCIPWI